MATLDPLIPTADQTLTAQVHQYDYPQNKSVLASMANAAPKALQAEINSASALRNPSYTRP